MLKQVSKDGVVRRGLYNAMLIVGTYLDRALATEEKKVHAETREIQEFRDRNTMCTIVARRMRDPEGKSERESK